MSKRGSNSSGLHIQEGAGDSADVGTTDTARRSKRLRSVKVKEAVEMDDFVVDDAGVSTKKKSKRARNEKVNREEKVESDVEDLKVRDAHNDKVIATKSSSTDEEDAAFVGNPVPVDEAKARWPKRYLDKDNKHSSSDLKKGDVPQEIIQARHHFMQAKVDGQLYHLLDDAYVNGEDGQPNFICKIVELFESRDAKLYFTAQWYYRDNDTVIGDAYSLNKKRVFFSEIMDVNPLNCLVEKLTIARLPLGTSQLHSEKIEASHYYCDMLYRLPYSTFVQLPQDNSASESEASSTISSDDKNDTSGANQAKSYALLDLYSGCGGMSTGLCLGAKLAKLNLVTKWAIDLNTHACESLKLNHQETEVRNETVENFLSLLKEWRNLCIRFSLISNTDSEQALSYPFDDEDTEGEDSEEEEDNMSGEEIFEVEEVLAICYGDPKSNDQIGLYFKVHWKGYGPNADSWEPLAGLSNCRKTIETFVRNGFAAKILPLRGDVDVICGGPPCQGISGFNRFRNKAKPLADEKNNQLLVYMDVVKYLNPKFVLMENVVDLVKFSNGFLGRYALGSLIDMNYQVRMGMMAAGSYGLPQFRMRVFIWGARSSEKLPQYPLPTHDVVVRGLVPTEFEPNNVAYENGLSPQIEGKLLLGDAISDLPEVQNNEERDEMPYGKEPNTEFQRLIRKSKDELMGTSSKVKRQEHMLYDHRPLQLNIDDYQRVCQIPKKKGANFRDLRGVRVRADKKVEWDPNVERIYLESGKPLVPDYAMSFNKGLSKKPFGRLWWDQTVPTVVTRAEPHNQEILHPLQDRVLTVRENARLQGFPDYYRLLGPVKERYTQVGNAVAVPVARALGYSLGLAWFGALTTNGYVFTLPQNFPNMNDTIVQSSSGDDAMEP